MSAERPPATPASSAGSCPAGSATAPCPLCRVTAVELKVEDSEDPAEVYFSDYRAVEGRMVPHRLQVYSEGKHYATFELETFRAGK